MALRRHDRIDGRGPAMTTPDELVVHLREAGAKRVFLARPDAFRDGSLHVVATYPIDGVDEADDSEGAANREMLVGVFEAIDPRLRFHDREWALDWDVEPAYADPRPELIPLYDRAIERKHGDGFILRNLLFVYEEFLERHATS